MKNIGRLSKIGLRAFQRNEQKTQYFKFTLVLITTRNNCKIKQEDIYIKNNGRKPNDLLSTVSCAHL